MKAWSKLSPAGRRVRVARDVLKWLRTGKLKAQQGLYLSVYDDAKARKITDEWGSRTTIESDVDHVNGHVCEACALGAVFAVAAENSNKIRRLGTLDASPWQMRGRLEKIFDLEQLALIETAFERHVYIVTDNQPAEDAAREFKPRLQSGKARMKAIMKNIIRNRGEFVPGDGRP